MACRLACHNERAWAGLATGWERELEKRLWNQGLQIGRELEPAMVWADSDWFRRWEEMAYGRLGEAGIGGGSPE